MNLFHKIKLKFEQTNHEELLRTMGYHNLKSGHKTLQKFLDTADIYLWLKNGNYDLKYSSEQFIEKLIETLSLTSIGKDELKQYRNRLDAISIMRHIPFIFVNTYSKRANQPIGNIKIDKELLVFQSKVKVLDMIGDIVKKHYFESEGNIPLCGDIITYIFHNTDGSKYIFNTDGTLFLDHHNITENRAEPRIGNKIIEGIK